MKGVSFGLVIVAFLGLILIIVSNSSMSYNGFDVDVVLSMVGSVLFVGTITGYIFENRTKEKLFGEIFERINKDLSIRNAGIESCFEASTDISYRDEIKHAREITTLFTYADGFLKRHMEELLDAATRGAILKFIFVRQDSQIISAMEGLGWAKTSISANYESLKVFEKRFEGKNVSFHYVDAIPRYAAVLFDEKGYVIEHTTSTGQRKVPALRVSKSGFIGKFYFEDVARLVEKNG